MIEVRVYNRKSKLPDVDYVLDDIEEFYQITSVLTPKFKGKWSIVLLDIKIKDVKEFLIDEQIPDFIDCFVLLPQNKLEPILLEFPKYQQKAKSNKEVYTDMVSTLKHLIEPAAMWSLYSALNGNIQKLEEALTKLDNECEGASITVKQVKTAFGTNNTVYASDVLEAFLMKKKHRWFLFKTLVTELGDEYAYYALFKQVRKLLSDKASYLKNEDVKNFSVNKIDAPLICYAYTLFATNSSWKNLRGIMWCLDNRSSEIKNLIE